MKEHHSGGLKSLFKKDVSPSTSNASSSDPSASHSKISKLFHHHKDEPSSSTAPSSRNSSPHDKQQHPPAAAGAPSPGPGGDGIKRASSVLSLRRRNTNPINNGRDRAPSDLQHPKPQHPLAATPNKKLTKAETLAHFQQIDNRNKATSQMRSTRTPSVSHSPGLETSSPNHEKIVYNPFGMNPTPSQEGKRNTSFYLSGNNDGERIVANPVANPNDYLPQELQQPHVNLLEEFEIDVGNKKLGDGGSSDVRIINSRHNKRHLYALKKFTMVNKETDEEFYKRVSKEYVIQKKCSQSRHVANVLAILRIQSQANLTRGWGVVMEFCSGGDLFSLIVRPGWKKSPLNEKYCLFKQIAYGLKFIHECDVAHRDLKPENVLLDGNGMAKLCDFGVSTYQHEIPGDFSSPVRLSTSYVGSPPYSPPEVMLLKDKSAAEAKNFAYDMFKSDHWALGMLLFCLVYGGVPFQQSSPTDHAYREYAFNHKRYCSDHSNFKNNKGFNKGPGVEFKMAAKFENTGASRVAWKLCDPSVSNRYDLELLFEDPWFHSVEMCLYEDPDQYVNPFVLPGTGENGGSAPSSGYSSQAPSRRGTFTKRNGSSSAANEGYNSHDEGARNVSSSNASLHSNEAHALPRTRSMLDFDYPSKQQQQQQQQQPQQQSSTTSSSNSSPKQQPQQSNSDHSPPNNLPALEESDIEHESESDAAKKQDQLEQQHIEHQLQLEEQKQLEQQQVLQDKQYTEKRTRLDEKEKEQQQEQQGDEEESGKGSPSSLSHGVAGPNPQHDPSSLKLPPSRQDTSITDDDDRDDRSSLHSLSDINRHYGHVLRNLSDLKLEADGTCDLGYKLKKHHHNEVSTAASVGRR
ncbi:PTK2 [Candida metapsilosis]|uniref:non-specific serine/threonine protein kinase n=1 Tax=Candida metapsilosis TaxID=273372 RepID=A0A8H7ZJ52_9ASCO|nr:PTK2 [Candida metapsilosis]